MAEVWLARSRGAAGFEKRVVIKRVLPHLMEGSEAAALLIREAKIAARLSHPNIVQIFDLGEEEGGYFIAMEFVHGRDLASALAFRPEPKSSTNRPGLDLPLRLWIVAEVAKALDYAHRRQDEEGRPLGIVHRDISPQNLLLGYEGEVKVADFGIARATPRELGGDEDPTLLRGKFAYMSPEQAAGDPLDRRSDIFSLGIVLWELIAGRRAFRGGSKEETLRLVREVQLPDLDLASIGAPLSLGPLLSRALAADPDARFASASEVQTALSEILYRMGAQAGSAALGQVMQRIFPPGDVGQENKLRVNLASRRHEDLTALSVVPALGLTPPAPVETTQAFPHSRQLRAEDRPLVMLCVPSAEAPAALERVAADHGGLALPPLGAMREILFGVDGEWARAALAASRTALELQRLGRVRMLLRSVEARVFGAGAAEPSAEDRRRAEALLTQIPGGEIGVGAALQLELGDRFLIEGEPLGLLRGFRARSEREALALRRGVLVGREPELARLSRAASSLRRGHGDAICIKGDAGSGKSRLVAEFRVRLDSLELIFAQADRVARDEPYGVIRELFADLAGIEEGDPEPLRGAKSRRLRVLGLSDREVAFVAALLGGGAEVAPRPGRPRGLELILALLKALRTLSTDAPLLVVIEDLQWVDDSTRQLLPLLLRGLRRARVLVLLTTRHDGAPRIEEAEELLLPLLEIGPAARLFASVLGAASLSAELQAELLRATAGNPAWIEACAEHLREIDGVVTRDGVISLRAGTSLGVPERVVARVAGRMRTLTELEAQILRVLAAFGRPVPSSHVEETLEIHREPVRGALRRLLSRRLLRPHEQGGRPWRGRGSWGGDEAIAPLPTRLSLAGGTLSSAAVLVGVPDAERSRLHGAVLRVLERRGARAEPVPPHELAHHAEQAGDEARAADYLEQAAREAERSGELRLAADRYREMLRICAALPASSRIFPIVERSAELALHLGDPASAEAILARYGDRAGADAASQARLALIRAGLASRFEVPPRLAEPLREALARAPELEDDLRAELLLALGWTLGLDRRFAEASALLRGWLPRFDREDPALARLFAAAAVFDARLGDAIAALEHGRSALLNAAQTGDPVSRLCALLAEAERLEALSRPGDALEIWSIGHDLARRERLEDAAAAAIFRAALCAQQGGDGVLAWQLAEAAAAEASARRNRPLSSLVGALRAVLVATEATAARARVEIDQAVERLLRSGHGLEAESARALYAWLPGAPTGSPAQATARPLIPYFGLGASRASLEPAAEGAASCAREPE